MSAVAVPALQAAKHDHAQQQPPDHSERSFFQAKLQRVARADARGGAADAGISIDGLGCSTRLPIDAWARRGSSGVQDANGPQQRHNSEHEEHARTHGEEGQGPSH